MINNRYFRLNVRAWMEVRGLFDTDGSNINMYSAIFNKISKDIYKDLSIYPQAFKALQYYEQQLNQDLILIDHIIVYGKVDVCIFLSPDDANFNDYYYWDIDSKKLYKVISYEVEHRPIELKCRDFKHNLRLWMIYRGMDQVQLSKRSGISQPSISNYIYGKTVPTFYSLYKLAIALGCNISDLLRENQVSKKGDISEDFSL